MNRPAFSTAVLLLLSGCAAAPECVEVRIALPGAQATRELGERFPVDHRTEGNGSDRRWVLAVGSKKILENARAPLETQWLHSGGRAFLMVTDHHATGNTRLWVYDTETGGCRRGDGAARRDLLGAMGCADAKLWSRGYGVRTDNGALHIAVTARWAGFSRGGLRECTRHYDVDIATGEIVKRYPMVVTVKVVR